MRILFAGDASNMHNALAHELRKMGHEATVASDGSRWMDTHRDIDLSRQPGFMGTLRYLLDIKRALPQMTGYDVVEIASPIFLRRSRSIRLSNMTKTNWQALIYWRKMFRRSWKA